VDSHYSSNDEHNNIKQQTADKLNARLNGGLQAQQQQQQTRSAPTSQAFSRAPGNQQAHQAANSAAESQLAEAPATGANGPPSGGARLRAPTDLGAEQSRPAEPGAGQKEKLAQVSCQRSRSPDMEALSSSSSSSNSNSNSNANSNGLSTNEARRLFSSSVSCK